MVPVTLNTHSRLIQVTRQVVDCPSDAIGPDDGSHTLCKLGREVELGGVARLNENPRPLASRDLAEELSTQPDGDITWHVMILCQSLCAFCHNFVTDLSRCLSSPTTMVYMEHDFEKDVSSLDKHRHRP